MTACDQLAQEDSQAAPSPSWQVPLAVTCFFTSGFVALALEICWIRKASLVFGTATFALSTVLAVFFGGLAAGSYLFGRWSERIRRPLRMYAAVEIGVGLLALLSPLAFIAADLAYGLIYPAISENFVLMSLVRLVLVAIILLPPTVLMGATLPLFCRQFVNSQGSIARSVGLLYGVNTLGAAIGCAACGFLMIRYIGVERTIYLCSGLNIVVGIVAWRIPLEAVRSTPVSKEDGTSRQASESAAQRKDGRTRAFLVPLLFFIAGYVALANEVLWTRFLSLLMHNTVYTYTLTLTVVLLGIVIGSMIVRRWADQMRRRALLFGGVQVAIGIAVMLVMMLPAAWWEQWRDPMSMSSQLWLVMAVLLVPGILSGISFPLAIRMVVTDPSQAGQGVGRMAALNTLGGIGGALSVGFLVLPLCGLHKTLWLTTALSIGCGIVAWIWLERATAAWMRAALSLGSVAIWMAVPLVMGTELPASHLANNGALVDFREGISSQVAVVRREESLQLEIDRLWQGENRKNHQIMAAHLPMLLHPAPQSALVIGIGPGKTAQRFLMYPSLEKLVCVDIERELIPLVRLYFDGQWLDDPRVKIIFEDGRNYVTHTDQKFDVISIEVGQAFRPGVASFYSAEFYERAKEQLKPGGLVSQFAPLGFFSHRTDEFRTVVRTFMEVFPNCVLWYNDTESLLIGSLESEIRLSPERLALIVDDERIHRDLEYSPWGGPKYWLNQPAMILGGFLAGRDGLENLAADAAVYHDDRPYLEYTANSHFSAAEFPVLQLIQANLDPIESVLDDDANSELVSQAQTIRTKNLRDIAADSKANASGQAMARGDHRQAESLVREALRLNPDRVRLYSRLGIILLHQEELEAAIAIFREGLARDPNDVSCLLGLGLAHLRSANLDLAIAALKQAAARSPSFADPHFHLGHAYRQRNNHLAAIEAYQEALRIEPDDAMTHFHLGSALEMVDRPKDAAGHLREAVRISPDAMPARNSLAWLLATHPDTNVSEAEEAVRHGERIAEQTDYRNAAVLDTLAAAYASAGRFAEATSTARAALELASPDKNQGLAAEIRLRLQLYQNQRPYRASRGQSGASD